MIVHNQHTFNSTGQSDATHYNRHMEISTSSFSQPSLVSTDLDGTSVYALQTNLSPSLEPTAVHAPHGNVSLALNDVEWKGLALLTSSCCVQILVLLVMVATCSLLGTVGNIPVLLVYCTKRDQRTSTTFIKALAIIDLLVCAVIMPYTIIMELHLVTSDIVCRLFEFMRHISITASNLTLVAIAIERYLAVCRIRHRLTVRNVQRGMTLVAGLSLLVSEPSPGLFTLSTPGEVENVPCAFPHVFHGSFAFCHFNTSFLGPIFSLGYQAVLMLIFFVNAIVIIVLYALIHSSLWKRAKRRPSSQPFKSDFEVSSCGEIRRSRQTSCPGSDLNLPEHPPQDDARLCLSSETGECSSEEQVNLLAASGELKVLPSPVEESPCPAGGERGSGGVQQRVSMHRRTTRMLFLCTVVFLVTWLPFWVDVFSMTHNLCLRYMFFVGNATNPLVYSIANSHFRRSFVKLIVRFRRHCPCSRHP